MKKDFYATVTRATWETLVWPVKVTGNWRSHQFPSSSSFFWVSNKVLTNFRLSTSRTSKPFKGITVDMTRHLNMEKSVWPTAELFLVKIWQIVLPQAPDLSMALVSMMFGGREVCYICLVWKTFQNIFFPNMTFSPSVNWEKSLEKISWYILFNLCHFFSNYLTK